MADEALTYLAGLTKPTIIEEIDVAAIKADRVAALVEKFDAAGVPYDVDQLATDSAVILTEEAAGREMLLRARGNDIARARYRLWATGADLDWLAEYWGLRRMDGEDDDRLNERITLAQQGGSVAGPEAYWARIAMAADIRVASVRVWRERLLPILHVSVLSTDNGGVADADLLATVRAAVMADDVRPMSPGTIVVDAAVRRLLPVRARLRLLPGTSSSLLETLAAALPAKWAAEAKGGRDLTIDWLKAALVVAGVYDATIVEPAATVVADDNETIRIGAVDLVEVGRAF